mgnify:FL=1
MIASVDSATTTNEKLALVDSIIDKHREAIELLRDLKISLIIQRSQEKNKENSNDT